MDYPLYIEFCWLDFLLYMLKGGKPIEDAAGKNSDVGILITLVRCCCDISLLNKFFVIFIIKNQLTD